MLLFTSFSIFILLVSTVRATVFSSSLKACQDQCGDRNLAFPLTRGEVSWSPEVFDSCGYGCHLQSCHRGCHDLDETISKCSTICAEEGIRTDSCMQGCNAVEQAFIVHIQELANEVGVSIEVVPEGIRLKWEYVESVLPQLQEIAAADVQWFAQVRARDESKGWHWHSMPPTAFRNGTLSAEVVVPVLAVKSIDTRLAITYRNRAVVSRPVSYQLPITVLPPTIEFASQLQLGPNKVAICWKTSNEKVAVKINVVSLDGNSLQEHTTGKSCYLLKDLPSENCCRVTITEVVPTVVIPEGLPIPSDVTIAPVTPPPQTSFAIDVKTKKEDPLIDTNAPELLITNGSHVLKVLNMDDYVFAEEPLVIPFDVPDGDSLTALAPISPNVFLLGSQLGAIWKITFDNNGTHLVTEAIEQVRQSQGEGSAIVEMVYDPNELLVYSVVGDRGMVRCPLTGGGVQCLLYANVDTLNPVRQIVIDFINGFMYLLCADHQVYRGELFLPGDIEGHALTDLTMLEGCSAASAIDLEPDNFKLLVSLKNSTLLSVNLITNDIKIEKTASFADLSRLQSLNGRLFWTREKCGDDPIDVVCFYSETKLEMGELPKEEFKRYLYPHKLLDFTFLTIPPTLFSLQAPTDLRMSSNSAEGHVVWKKPEGLPYQAKTAWQRLSYEMEINEEGSVETKKTNNTFVDLPVRPGREYIVKVRTCADEVCSLFTMTTDTAPVWTDPPFIFLRKTSETVEAFDSIGKPLEYPAVIGLPLNIDIRHAFAIDNTTMTSFSVSQNEMSVISAPLSSSSTSLPHTVTSLSSIQHISLLPSRALVIISTAYQIISYRFTGTLDHVFYTCASPECGEVVSLTTDDHTGEVYFGIRQPSGVFALYEANQDDRTPTLVAESGHMPKIKQFHIAKEKIVFLTAEGLVGFCDKHLESINVRTDLPAMDRIIPLSLEQGTNFANFVGEITLSPEKKSELEWSSEPRQPPGRYLYKIFFYRDKILSGEPRIELTPKNEQLLPTDLLEQWNSAQRFDVSIEGITAWTTFSINKTGLQAPVKPPTAPINTKLYATQQKTVDGARAIITFFWSPPTQWNGTPFQYIVNCIKEDGTTQGGPVSSTISHYAFAVKSGKVTCQVAAANEPTNIGEYSTANSIDSSELKPLVRLFAIDSTNSLMAITNISGTEEAKREKRETAKMEYLSIAFIGNELFAVRREPDSIQPVLVQIDTNDINNIVHKVSIGGDVSKIEAMTSDWVGNRLLFVSGSALYQISLDPFLTTSLLNPRKLIELSTLATDAKQLTFDPFKNTAYLLTRNGSLFSLNLSTEKELNMALAVPCLFSQTVTWMMTEFAWNRASSPKIYALTWNGLIVVDVEENSKCDEVRIDWNKFGEKGLKAMSAFAIADKLFVFVTSAEMLIYGREAVFPIPISNPPLRQILAVSQSSQPFPDRSCFALPSSTGIQFSVKNEGKTGCLLEVQKPPPPTTCTGVSFPQTHFEVYFTRKNADKVKHIRSFSEKIHVENGILDKETDYDVTVAWLNRYSDVQGISTAKPFRTGFGYPSAPRDLNVVTVTPDTVFIYWTLPETLNAPIDEIRYKISQQASGLSSPSSIAIQEWKEGIYSTASTDTATCLASPCRVKISNLRPSTEYKFWSTALHTTHLNSQFLEDTEAMSLEASARTKDIPGTLRPDNVTGSSILLRWNSLQAEQPPTSISIQYKESGNIIDWKAPANASFTPNVTTILVQITNLLSATSYDYRFVAAYTGSYSMAGKDITFKEDYYQAVQQAKTKAGVPTSPVGVDAQIDEEGWIVSWQEPMSDGGSRITSYAVEMRHNRTAEWEIGDRGLDGWKLWWRPAKSTREQLEWEFRVRAANQEGFGPYATSTDNKVYKPETPAENNSLWIVLASVLGTILCLLILIFCCIQLRRRGAEKKRKTEDKNCITLEKIAHHDSINSQLVTPEMKNEMNNLPHMYNEYLDDLDDLKKLGQGSFGEVYAATVNHLPIFGERQMKVAVKYLRNSHDESAKIRFIKEAILMNNFDHPNIVKLYGVNLTRDPYYLILELMECGDLLRYLRGCRPTETAPSQLSLRDLVGMMIDIGRGCSYLEMSKHVHRDLAARNCLVSIDSHGNRVTKIADFGLARGIFSKNFFKATGENFLPVRWLSPEALQGTFSSKSDVWSYGVLLFEIMTLGEQPYGHLNNEKVRETIREGGYPGKPMYCPEPIFRLMRYCWIHEPQTRSSFYDLLSQLEHLRELPEFQEDKPFPPAGGHLNEGFNSSHDSTSSEMIETTPTKEMSLFPARSYNGHEKINEASISRLDRSFGGQTSAESRKQKAATVRSLRKDKKKPSPLPTPEEADPPRVPFYGASRSGNMASEGSSFDYNTPPYVQSPSALNRNSFNLSANPQMYEMPMRRRSGILEEGRNEDENHFANSWAAGSHPPPQVIENSLYNNSQHSLPATSFANRPGVSGVNQVQRTPSRGRNTPSSHNSYSNSRHSKVSQV